MGSSVANLGVLCSVPSISVLEMCLTPTQGRFVLCCKPCQLSPGSLRDRLPLLVVVTLVLLAGGSGEASAVHYSPSCPH